MNKILSFCMLLALAFSIVSCSQSSSAIENETPVTQVSNTSGEEEAIDWSNIPIDPKAVDNKKGVEIVVKANGFPSDEIYIANYYGSQHYIQDTIKVVNNKAVIKKDEKYARGIYMFVFPPQNTFLDVIMGYDQHFEVSFDSTALKMIPSIKVKGSVENEVFYTNLQENNDIGTQITPLQTEYDSLADKSSARAKELEKELRALYQTMNDNRDKIAAENPGFFYSKVIRLMQDPKIPDNPDPSDSTFDYRYYKAHYWDKMDWSEPGMINTPVFIGRLNNYMDRLVYQQPDSLAKEAKMLIDLAKANDTVFQTTTVTLLNKYAKSKIMGFDAVYVGIVEHTYAQGLAFWSSEEQVKKIMERARALSPTLVGSLAPPIRMTDTNDKPVDMYQVPGKFTVLYFWDYDCGHCKKVTPKLAKLFPKYKGKDIALVTVSINGAIDVWKKKLGEYGLDKTDGIHLQDHTRQTGFSSQYDMRTTPRIFLLDKDKKILAKQISVEQLEEILDKELAEKS